MTKRRSILVLACAVALSLSACAMGGTTMDTASTASDDTASEAPKTTEDSTYDATTDGRPVITIDIPEEIPAADRDGEIPGSDASSNSTRDTVTFGNLYQDASGNTLTPLKWIILDEKDGYSLLMSEQIVASKGWMDEQGDGATWTDTDLRRWLDRDFYDTAFSDEEKSHMALFDATQQQNPRYDSPAGEATVDPVSLLSYQELIHYMPTDGERKTSPTDYAIAEGCYQNPDGDAAWWLRSPGPSAKVPEHLASWGNLGARTHYIDDSTIGVRPVV